MPINQSLITSLHSGHCLIWHLPLSKWTPFDRFYICTEQMNLVTGSQITVLPSLPLVIVYRPSNQGSIMFLESY